MAGNSSDARQRSRRRRQLRESSSSEEIEAIDLNMIPSPATTNSSTTIVIPSIEQV